MRAPRELSITGIYHVVLRGINKQDIFFDEYDYKEFINCMRQCKDDTSVEYYAYCLMNNHIHILLCEGDDSIDNIMQRILIKFVKWYNKKYDRRGPLFEGRYRSECVESELYFVNAVRYIIQNPIHAGLESSVGDSYRWNCFQDYKQARGDLLCIDKFFSFFSDYTESLTFLSTLKSDDSDLFLEPYDGESKSDSSAIALISDEFDLTNPTELQRLDSVGRKDIVQRLIQLNIPIRQIARITGISRSTIYRITR